MRGQITDRFQLTPRLSLIYSPETKARTRTCPLSSVHRTGNTGLTWGSQIRTHKRDAPIPSDKRTWIPDRGTPGEPHDPLHVCALKGLEDSSQSELRVFAYLNPIYRHLVHRLFYRNSSGDVFEKQKKNRKRQETFKMTLTSVYVKCFW